MEETKKEEGMGVDAQKQWNEASNLETREDRSAFNLPQPTPNIFQQQTLALCSQLPSVGLQNSGGLPQMPIYPSRFYYQCYAPPPYSRPMFDPCVSYPALYQSEGNNNSLSHELIACHSVIKNIFEYFGM